MPQTMNSSPSENANEISIRATEDGSKFIIQSIAASSDNMISEATIHVESPGSVTPCSDFEVFNARSNSTSTIQLPHKDANTRHSCYVITNPVVISHLRKHTKVKSFKGDRYDGCAELNSYDGCAELNSYDGCAELNSYDGCAELNSLECLRLPDTDIYTVDESDSQAASSSNLNTVIHRSKNSFRETCENFSNTKQGFRAYRKARIRGKCNYEFQSCERKELQRSQADEYHGLKSSEHAIVSNVNSDVRNIMPNLSTNVRYMVPTLSTDVRNILEDREDEERMERLQVHKKIYVGRNPYECERCDYFTVDKYKYTIHQRIHSGEKPFKCAECDFCTTYKSVLKVHRRSHNGEKPYKCDSCNYSSVTSSALRVHRRMHTGEKPYKCNQCNFCTARKADLKYHLRTHTGEKPYKCDECDYEAATVSQVKVHHRIHTGEKPYKCDQCDYCSTQKYKITIHQRVHTGDKPYKCDKCEFDSTQKYKIKLHKQLNHTTENSRNKSETKSKSKLKVDENQT